MTLANFQKALQQLGADDVERGKVLGVSERTVRLWRAKAPNIVRIIARTQALAAALNQDAANQETQDDNCVSTS